VSSSDETQEKIAELRSEHNRLTTAATLRHKQDELRSLERELSELTQTAQKLTQGGYAGGAVLSGQIQVLSAKLAQSKALFTQVVTAASARLQAELGQANLGVGGALGGQTSLLDSATEALETLSGRVETAEGQLDSVLEPFTSAQYELDTLFNRLTWSQEQWGEFSGDKNAGGGLLIACEAEWKQTGKGGDDPDGILFLTDKALIFEQKEKKGKTFGMFGGKMVQEVEWSIPLGQISDVRSKNEGVFGGKDILFLTVSGGDPAPEVKIEVKGSADNKAWMAYIAQAKQGAPLFSAPDVVAPEIDLSEWDGSSTSFGVNFTSMGGALAGIAAGVKSGDGVEDAKPKGLGGGGSVNAMKGLAQSGSKSNDDDDDEKGGQKPSGNVSGGPKGGQKSD